jgi:hypothetical protein
VPRAGRAVLALSEIVNDCNGCNAVRAVHSFVFCVLLPQTFDDILVTYFIRDV